MPSRARNSVSEQCLSLNLRETQKGRTIYRSGGNRSQSELGPSKRNKFCQEQCEGDTVKAGTEQIDEVTRKTKENGADLPDAM